MDDNDFNLQTYTPGSDISAGFEKNQAVWGRTGNDIILGYQPILNDVSQSNIDILIGDLEIPLLEDPFQRNWSNTFILGDWLQPYYANGELFSLGLNDFALIVDFEPEQDFIQLYGQPEDYQLTNVVLGTAISLSKEIIDDFIAVPDVIAIIPTFDLSLDDDYFQFVGYNPPQVSITENIQQLGTSTFDIASAVTTDTLNNLYVTGGTNGSLGGENNSESRDIWIAKYNSEGEQEWVQQFGSPDFDTPSSIATDKAGNLYLAGSTKGNLVEPKEADLFDSWLAKFDSDGNQLWIQQFGEGFAFNAYTLDVDDNGNTVLGGTVVNVTDTEAVLPNTDDIWLAKYDTDGNQLWLEEFGDSAVTAFEESFGIAIDRSGNVYSTGFTSGDLVGTNAGLYDVWLTKHDTNGELEWIRQIGTEDYEWGWGVDTDSNGNVYLGGYTLGDLDGNNAGSYDTWLAKYDSNGNQLWIEQFGSPGDDEAFNLKIDSQDNIFLVGYTDDDLGGTNAGSFDAWVARFNTDGEQQWIQQFGTPQTDQAYDITFDNDNNLFVTGLTDGSLGDTNQGSFDAWIAKLDVTSGLLKDFNSNSTPTLPIDIDGSKLADRLIGNSIDNRIRGFGGSDRIFGKFGDDELYRGTGDDFLKGGVGSDLLFGGIGDDLLRGDFSDDQLYGGADDDLLQGGLGDDLLKGNSGNDLLKGKEGNDRLNGGRGNDVLEGGIGLDPLIGGTGRDLFVLLGKDDLSDFDTILDFEDGQDSFRLKDGLTFNQLLISQGTEDRANDTFISLDSTGEVLAALIDVEASSLTREDFTTV